MGAGEGHQPQQSAPRGGPVGRSVIGPFGLPIRRREVEGNWIQGNRSDLREFKTVVKSLHDRPMRITVLDQMPFSENAAITVETIPNMTAPTEKNLQDRRGVLAWTYEYKPGEEKEIRHGFRIRWPGERELVLEPQPVVR